MPRTSYIISAYNSANFLPGLLDDLLRFQTEKDIEVVVVDSNSPEGEFLIACEANKIDNRIIPIHQEVRTPYGVSWLDGWKKAQGVVVGNSNTDDRSKPWRTAAVTNAYRSGSVYGYHFYYGGYETHKNGVCIAKGIPPEYSEADWAELFRGGVHLHWDNDLRDIVNWERMYKAAWKLRSAFDYWLMLYFISLGAKGIRIPQIISIYNQREDSLEQSDKKRNMFESLFAIEEFYPDGVAITNLKKDQELYAEYLEFKESLNV